MALHPHWGLLSGGGAWTSAITTAMDTNTATVTHHSKMIFALALMNQFIMYCILYGLVSVELYTHGVSQQFFYTN